MKKIVLLALVTPLLMVTGCNQRKVYFSLWNECDALTTLKNYVEDVTNEKSSNYIPVEDRIVTFDMDGTFVGELYPTYFEYNMLEYRGLDDPTYTDKDEFVVKTATDIRNHVRYGEAYPDDFPMQHARASAIAYSGMTMDEFDAYVKAYAQNVPYGFTGMTYATSFYKPMLEVFDYLTDYNFTYYVVSGSDRLLCRALVSSLGIAPNRVIGMDVNLVGRDQGDARGVDYTLAKDEDVLRGDELIIKNLKMNKVQQIQQEIGKHPVLSFGNSDGDAAMHNFCLSNPNYKSNVFMLVADDNVRDHADLNKAAQREAEWRANGYNVISMKNNFKTIYGDGVEVVPFPF